MRQVHARGVAGRRIGVEHEASRRCRASTEPPAKVPTRSFGPCRSTRMPIGRPCSLLDARGSSPTSSRMRSCEVWLMLMRNTSAPASNSRAIMRGVAGGRSERGDDLGAAQASHCGAPRGSCDGACRPRRRQHRRAAACSGRCCGACSAVSVSCTVQARCSPVSTSKKPVRSIAARQAILGAADGEFLVARAHEGVAGPFAAAVVIDRVDVIEARDQRALQQGLAGCAPTGSTSPRWSSPRCPCSRSRCRPGCRCCCRGGSRPWPAARARAANAAASATLTAASATRTRRMR